MLHHADFRVAESGLEVGLVGNEGMFGIPVALGVDMSPVRAVVQGAGSALRMDAAPFCRELERSQALRREIDRYVFVQLSQLVSEVTRWGLEATGLDADRKSGGGSR